VLGAATATPWRSTTPAGVAPDVTRLPYTVLGFVRHLRGAMHARREWLEGLALAALRDSVSSQDASPRTTLMAIRRALDGGQLDWLGPAAADALRAILAPLAPAASSADPPRRAA
jgi:hypothetical protein